MDPWGRSKLSVVAMVVLASAACSREANKVVLTPPFDEQAKIGEITAQWEATAEERAFADGRKLDEVQVRVHYRVDALNRLQDKLFVRLGDFRLLNESGIELGKDTGRIECALSAGQSNGVLSGDVWLSSRAVKNVGGFGITHLAVPLSERGRALYREWALKERAAEASTVDVDIQRFAAAGSCPRQ
jgi:hypothetical protein